MTNIGCDIGKSNLDVYFKGKLKRYRNDKTGISEFLKDCLVNDESRVILEPSGGYEKDLLMKLHELKIAVSVVNPYYVRNFARSVLVQQELRQMRLVELALHKRWKRGKD